jgi:hypothetical protein
MRQKIVRTAVSTIPSFLLCFQLDQLDLAGLSVIQVFGSHKA